MPSSSSDGGGSEQSIASSVAERLIERIRAAIEAAGGRIIFRDFMELALYDDVNGYYHAPGEKTGRKGDFLTSPLVSPLFGRTLRRFLERQFSEGVPRRLLELGAGDGSLAAELADLAPYLIVERSADFRARQAKRLQGRVSWADEVPAGFEGIVLSNELLDALPVHRLDRDRELYVRWQDGFVEELGPYSTVELARYFERLGLQPAGRAEVNLDAMRLMAGVYDRVQQGLILTIDYGYEAKEQFVGHPQGTFLTYHRHGTDDRAFEYVGQKDMTSHVDFSSLILLGDAKGWPAREFTTQAEFLIENGIGELLMDVQRTARDVADYTRAREAVTTLLAPRGMGGFRVLVQERSIT